MTTSAQTLPPSDPSEPHYQSVNSEFLTISQHPDRRRRLTNSRVLFCPVVEAASHQSGQSEELLTESSVAPLLQVFHVWNDVYPLEMYVIESCLTSTPTAASAGATIIIAR